MAPTGRLDRVRNQLDERRAIQQPRHLIVRRKVLNSLFRGSSVGDVFDDGDVVDRGAVVVTPDRSGNPDPNRVAFGPQVALFDDRSIDFTLVQTCAIAIRQMSVFRVGDLVDRQASEFLTRVSEHLAELLVHPHEAAIGIDVCNTDRSQTP